MATVECPLHLAIGNRGVNVVIMPGLITCTVLYL